MDEIDPHRLPIIDPRDHCAYCGHERGCHVIFRSGDTETQVCHPKLQIGPFRLNTKWLSNNWCGCQKFQESGQN